MNHEIGTSIYDHQASSYVCDVAGTGKGIWVPKRYTFKIDDGNLVLIKYGKRLRCRWFIRHRGYHCARNDQRLRKRRHRLFMDNVVVRSTERLVFKSVTRSRSVYSPPVLPNPSSTR